MGPGRLSELFFPKENFGKERLFFYFLSLGFLFPKRKAIRTADLLDFKSGGFLPSSDRQRDVITTRRQAHSKQHSKTDLKYFLNFH